MKINSQIRFSVVGLILMGLAMIFANLPFQYETASTDGTLQLDPIQRATEADDVALPVAAGWPAKFYYRFEHGTGVPVHSQWSPAALLLNLGLLVGVMSIVLFVQRRALKKRDPTDRSARRQVSIADLILLTFLVAIPLGYWQGLKRGAQREWAIAKQLEQYGSFQRSADIPAILVPYLPSLLVDACMRVTDVDLNAPDDDAVAAAMQLPHLRSLRIGGGQYDLRHLDALPNMTHLTVLQLSGRVLDVRSVQVVRASERLRVLDMSRTNLSADALALIGELPRLRVLVLVDSGVRLTDLDAAICPATLERLELPRPEPGGRDAIKLSGYPALQTLAFHSRDAGPNASVLQLHLQDLPALKVLQLDLLQKYDLRLERLPQLEKLESLASDWKLRLAETESFPFEVWLESLNIAELDRLRVVNFYAAEIQQIQIRDTPALESVGVAMGRYQPDGSVHYETRFAPQKLELVLEGLADCDGPAILDLSFVPLAGADLQPLARNPRLTALNLAQSQTSMKEWKSLRGMTQLVHLNVAGNQEEGRALQYLVRQFPNLQTITMGMQTLRSINLQDHAQLTHLQLDSGAQQRVGTVIESPFLQQVRLVNLPRLANTFRLSPWVSNVHMQGVPAVQGLAFQGPLSTGTVLQGFRDLQWFAAGGAAIDDAVADQLLACDKLEHLTLAYATVSNDKLRDLLETNPIRTLNLTGCQIDDTVFADWQGVGNLQEIILDETRLTERTVERLVAANSLLMLSINGIPIGEELLGRIGGLTQLAALRIAGTPCSPQVLGRLLQSLPLSELDLSGQPFTAAHAQAILAAGSDRLRVLGLRDAKIDPQAIAQLARSLDGLVFDIAGADLPASVQGDLLAARRLVVEEDDMGGALVPLFMGAMEANESAWERACPRDAVIDVKRFAPDKLEMVYE